MEQSLTKLCLALRIATNGHELPSLQSLRHSREHLFPILRHPILERRLVNQWTRFRLDRAPRNSSSTARAMFIVFFDDCLVKNGVVTRRGLQTMVAILDTAKPEVTDEELRPNVTSLHHTGERT